MRINIDRLPKDVQDDCFNKGSAEEEPKPIVVAVGNDIDSSMRQAIEQAKGVGGGIELVSLDDIPGSLAADARMGVDSLAGLNDIPKPDHIDFDSIQALQANQWGKKKPKIDYRLVTKRRNSAKSKRKQQRKSRKRNR